MKPWMKFNSWRRQQRRLRAARKHKNDPLREFAYLDDVSVYSLIASRIGAIATEFTNKEILSLQGEVTSSAEAGGLGVKGSLKSRLQGSSSSESQVVRKSLVQTAFRDLYKYEKDTLTLRPVEANSNVPTIRNAAELKRATSASEFSGWIVNASTLRRGQLLEVEVELEAEPLFRLTTIVSSVMDIFQDNLELFADQDFGDLTKVGAIQRVLEKLLAGLTPVRGRLLDYKVVVIDGSEHLVHTKLLEQLSADDKLETRDLYLAAVTEQSKYWRDIRRVLFSKNHYRVLARVSRDNIEETWTPIKLADVLGEIAPDLADQMNNLSNAAFDKKTGLAAAATGETIRRASAEQVLSLYAQSVAELAEIHYNEENVRSAGVLTLPDKVPVQIVEWREALQPITKYFEERAATTIDRQALAQRRSEILQSVDGTNAMSVDTSSRSAVGADSERKARFLNAEIVAIYW